MALFCRSAGAADPAEQFIFLLLEVFHLKLELHEAEDQFIAIHDFVHLFFQLLQFDLKFFPVVLPAFGLQNLYDIFLLLGKPLHQFDLGIKGILDGVHVSLRKQDLIGLLDSVQLLLGLEKIGQGLPGGVHHLLGLVVYLSDIDQLLLVC